MNTFEIATPARIVVGCGTVKNVASIAAEFGKRVLLVTGRSISRADSLVAMLRGQSLECATFAVDGEPTVAMVQEGVAAAREQKADVIVAFGGGSAIDAAKAVAALLTNPGDPLDYLEVIGRGRPIKNLATPCIAIPTTSGTGAEVTRNAVLGSPEHRVKVSLRSPLMLPRVAVIDPELTRGLPPAISASTGLDALTQLIEPFVSIKANPYTDAICREGIVRAARSLRRVCDNGDDLSAREDMSIASLFGGLALANAGLGAVHGFAGPMGGMFPVAHGAICAALLSHVMEANVIALRERQPASVALGRYEEVARLLTGRSDATAADGAAWVRGLCCDLQVKGLSACGLTRTGFETLIDKAIVASSMKGNPIALTKDELTRVLEAALA